MRRILFLLLLLLVPAILPAQESIGTRLDWGTVEVILYPSRALGMQLELSATGGGLMRPVHGMSGGFDPDAVFNWINSAAGIITPSAPPSGADVILLTPVLLSASGDSIRLMRRPKGKGWDRQIAVLIDKAGPRGDHFDVLAGPPLIEALLAGLQREAGLSGFIADSVAIAQRTGPPADDAEVTEIPRVLSKGPVIYPDRSKRGKIIIEFVVRADGTADPESFRTIYAEHAVFEQWARPMIAGARFKPGTLRGQPVNVLVRQAINFTS